jgi:hypothetical protein
MIVLGSNKLFRYVISNDHGTRGSSLYIAARLSIRHYINAIEIYTLGYIFTSLTWPSMIINI